MSNSENNYHHMLQRNPELRRQMELAEDISLCVRKVVGALSYLLTLPLPFLARRDYRLKN
ncbi:MAG: hypothetical protein V7731_09000 [Amphritea sp.]